MNKYIRIYYEFNYILLHTWRAELGWNDDSTPPPQSVQPAAPPASERETWLESVRKARHLPRALIQVVMALAGRAEEKGRSAWKVWRCLIPLRDQLLLLLLLQKKYIDLFSFSVELGREEKSIQSGNGLMTRSNFESIFCWWLFYFSFHRLELTIFSAQWRREAHRLRTTLSLYYREHKLRPSYLDRTINWFIREPHFFLPTKDVTSDGALY